jgi:hypothetical protein
VTRVRARVAETQEPGDVRQQTQELRKLRLVRVVTLRRRQRRVSEAVDRLPEQHDLARAGSGPSPDLFFDLGGGAIALGPARVGDHAKRAPLVTPLHGRDERAHGGLSRARLGRKKARGLQVEDRSRHGRLPGALGLDESRDLGEVVRADDEVDVGDALQEFVAFLLRDAASDAEHEIRASTLQLRELPGFAPELLFGLLAHTARVQDDEVGVFDAPSREPSVGREDLDHPVRVVNVHLAAERLHEVAARSGKRTMQMCAHEGAFLARGGARSRETSC